MLTPVARAGQPAVDGLGKSPRPAGAPSRRARPKLPVTTALLLQHVPLVVLPCLILGNPAASSVLFVVVVIVVCAATGELFLLPLVDLRRDRLSELAANSPPESLTLTFVVSCLSLTYSLGSAVSGLGSYAVQVGSAEAASWSALISPLRYCSNIAVTLLLIVIAANLLPVRRGLFWLVLVAVADLGSALYRGILGPSVSLLFVLGVVGLTLGVFTVKKVVVAAAAVVLLLPQILALRDEARSALPGIDAFERLRLDLLMANLPAGVRGTDLLDLQLLLRVAVVPRFLDPDRPELNAGVLINTSLGGSALSASTFTLFGNVYFFSGLIGLAVYIVVLVIMFFLMLHRLTPLRVVLAGQALAYLSWIGSSYPDNVVAFAQAVLITCIVVYVGGPLLRVRRADADSGARLLRRTRR